MIVYYRGCTSEKSFLVKRRDEGCSSNVTEEESEDRIQSMAKVTGFISAPRRFIYSEDKGRQNVWTDLDGLVHAGVGPCGNSLLWLQLASSVK